jgi:hypothetical protein
MRVSRVYPTRCHHLAGTETQYGRQIRKCGQKAIRIAANQNHGIYPLDKEQSSVLPNNHIIQNNEIRDNMIGIELEKVKGTRMDLNVMNNFAANLAEK